MHKTGLSRVEHWVDQHATWLAMGIIAVAFSVRVFCSVSCYLNPDEGGHFDVAAANSWVETMRASLRLAHPPLFILVLHAFLFLGRTELFVRLPSLLGGTAALWFAFAWIRRILGGVLALGGLGFMALSPLAISASVEVRQYGILLFFLCAALYATEVMFAERSTRWAILQGLFLLGASLTHYTALVPLACIGFYVLVRSLLTGIPRRILYTFLLFQFIIAGLLGLLYFGQVRGLIPFGRGASLDYLQHFYYTPASETPFQFTWRSISGTFLHAVGPIRLSYLCLFLFVIGLAALQWGRTKAPRFTALLAISPFVVGFVAAIVQVFPFGGSRHQTYLLPFLAVGIAAALSWLPRVSVVPILLLGVVIAPHWVSRALPDNNLQVDPLSDMTAAMEYVKQTIPPGATIYVDYETRQVLRYHLARNDWFPRTLQSGPAREQWYGGYRVVVPQENVWVFRPDEVLNQVTETARETGAHSGDPLWVVSVAWADPLFASRLPAGQTRDVKEFGMISVIRFPAQTR